MNRRKVVLIERYPDSRKGPRGERKQIMTMAVGFVCKDGIVIGADRQVTGANYTFPECKLKSLKWKNGHGIFGYSGNRDTYHDFLNEIWARFTPDAALTHDDVKRLIKETLKATELARKEQFFSLFGFWLDGERPDLFMSNAQRVVSVTECEVIGYADSPLARFFLGKFFDVLHFVTVHQARIYAVYFISEVKKYDGQYVGGGIDVYSIDMSGQNGERCVRVLDAGRTTEWEQQTNLIHYWWDVLFSQLTNKDNPVLLDQFNERMGQFRAWCAPEESQPNTKLPQVLFPSKQSTPQK